MKNKIAFIIFAIIDLLATNSFAEEKWHYYQDGYGQHYSNQWWKDLATCSGTLSSASIAIEDFRPGDVEDISNSANNFGALAKQRIIIDKQIDSAKANNEIMETIDAAIAEFAIAFSDINTDNEKYQFFDKTIENCNKFLSEYKTEFPEIFKN